MRLSSFQPDQSNEIIKFFSDVFTDSEGEDEGLMIGSLVLELIETTASSDLLGFVASSDDQLVACIFFSRLILPSGKVAFILSPVAVASNYQGKGIGQQLINFGLQDLKSRDVELVLTYGDPAFYSKVGFQQISEAIVKAPLKLTYPEGWLAQSLTQKDITPEAGMAQCVNALNQQKYW